MSLISPVLRHRYFGLFVGFMVFRFFSSQRVTFLTWCLLIFFSLGRYWNHSVDSLKWGSRTFASLFAVFYTAVGLWAVTENPNDVDSLMLVLGSAAADYRLIRIWQHSRMGCRQTDTALSE